MDDSGEKTGAGAGSFGGDFALDGLEFQPWTGPAILLVDLDAFFASVEQLDNPEWRGKPVIVGGDSDKRGVVSTCSYEAREFGVRSAMPAVTAARLCPQAIWTHGHFGRYREVSAQVMGIIRNETPHVQQVSIDEAFADITPTRVNREHPIAVARRIQSRVENLGVTCSIGLGATKSVAKVASDMDKPRGLTVVWPGSEADFLADLPVRAMSGVGPSAERALLARGIRTLGQMAAADGGVLRKIFGKNAEEMRARAAGSDFSQVAPDDGVKSVSHATTFAVDLDALEDIEAALAALCANVCRRLRRKGLKGHTLMLRVRYDDLSYKTAQTKLRAPSDDNLEMMPYLAKLIDEVWRPGVKVRLLGVDVSGFDADVGGQTALFSDECMDEMCSVSMDEPLIADASLRRELLSATDALKDRFGEDAVRFGSELRNLENTTGSGAKNPADYK